MLELLIQSNADDPQQPMLERDYKTIVLIPGQRPYCQRKDTPPTPLNDEALGTLMGILDGLAIYISEITGITRGDDFQFTERCPDCGEPGERKGHQACQYPKD